MATCEGGQREERHAPSCLSGANGSLLGGRSVKTHQAFRFALDPTHAHSQALASHCGAARFAFNWGLELVKKRLEARRNDGETAVPWTLPALRWAWNRAKSKVACHADTVGVDIGVLRLATLSTGEVMPGPRALALSVSRLRKLQRTVSRGQKGSTRRRRAIFHLARVHRRVRDVRRDYLHKFTTHLAKSHGRESRT